MNDRKNLAVTEIVGTILMLGIATTSCTGLYYHVLSAPVPIPAPIVEISGVIDDNQVIVTHRGGEPLDLDTELVLNIGGSYMSYKVEDFLDSKAKEDGVWGLSERFVYPLDYDFDYLSYPDVKINVVDEETSSLLLNGLIKVNPTCDIAIEIAVDNLYPKENEQVEFTITITNNGNINASGILIDYLLPEGLTYYSSTMDMGTSDSSVGIWDISQLPEGESAVLEIIAIVEEFCYSDPTQLVVILDGSESIEPANWSLMKQGLLETIQNSMPHNGAVEFTVIQFGGQKPAFARLEIGPIAVTESNVGSVLDKIQELDQIGKKTPTASGILMAADVLKASEMFDPEMRQVVLLVTDGNPTHCAYPDGDYLDDQCDDVKGPKVSTIDARDYLVDLLELNENDDDEFNALSIEVTGDGHTYFLRDDIVWPQPCIEISDITDDTLNQGWIQSVSSWQDFTSSINQSFKVIFNKIPVDVSIKSTGFSDPKDANDISSVVLRPIPKTAEIMDDDLIDYI
jgi:uncharacterized repeat protein (TIGR01451 family)